MSAPGSPGAGLAGVDILMFKNVLTCSVGLLVVLSAGDAAAQGGTPWTDRGYFNLNVGFESTSGDLNDATTFPIYGETASLSVDQAIDSGSFFDFSAGARVWKNFSAGIGFHQGSTHSEAAVQGSIPSPVVTDRPRPLALGVGDLTRSERAVHLQFGYMLVLSDKVNVHVMLGPSFFKLRQDVVVSVTPVEAGPPFTSVSGNPTVAEREDSSTGFNIGVDVGYTFYQTTNLKAGAGMFIRYSGASADVLLLSNTVDSDVGGLQVGFGGRLRF